MTEPSDDGIELIVPAFIPDEGLGKYVEELHRRIARDLALVVGEVVTERRTPGGHRIHDVSDPEIQDGLKPFCGKDEDL